MFRKLALAGAICCAFVAAAFAANAPTYKDPAGQDRDAIGVVFIGPDGTPASEVSSNEITISVSPTNTAVSYTTGQSIGGKLTFANAARVSGTAGAVGTSGLIQKVTIGSNVTTTIQYDLVVFKADPSSSTCTNAAAYSLAAADKNKVVGVAHVVDWTASASAYSGQALNLAIPYVLSSSTTLYGCLVARGGVTATGTTDFSIDLGLIRN